MHGVYLDLSSSLVREDGRTPFVGQGHQSAYSFVPLSIHEMLEIKMWISTF